MPRGTSRLDEARLQGRLWSPALLAPSLALWLDADDLSTITIATGVSEWRDKSGFARHFRQSTAGAQPAYRAQGFNARPCIENVSADTLTLGSSGLGQNVGGITCAIVGSHPAGVAFVVNASDFIVGNGTTGVARFVMTPNSNATNLYGLTSRRLDLDVLVQSSSSTDALANRGNNMLRVGQRDYTNALANHWTNGTQDLTAAAAGTAGSTSDTASFSSFIFAGGAGAAPNGSKVAEIVMTHSAMTGKDRQALEGYLAHKWGLTNNLPADHPFRNRPPLIQD